MGWFTKNNTTLHERLHEVEKELVELKLFVQANIQTFSTTSDILDLYDATSDPLYYVKKEGAKLGKDKSKLLLCMEEFMLLTIHPLLEDTFYSEGSPFVEEFAKHGHTKVKGVYIQEVYL